MEWDPKLAVVAIGGNATFPPYIKGTAEEQFEIVGRTCVHLARMIQMGFRLVLTHGNGPVIGNILIRMEMARHRISPMPMDICVADSQGGIGYIIQNCLMNRLRQLEISHPVVSLITQVEVRADDPAFQNPSKPIGPFYTQEEAERIARQTRWEFREDAGRGYRRMVPSPQPVAILEIEAIRELVGTGAIPIAAGGGGIPVVRHSDGGFRGVAAVIDKDLASALLAVGLRAGIFLILTGVDRVALDFGKPSQRFLSSLTAGEARAHLEAGQFPEGSMRPKIEAALRYLDGEGKTVIITSLERSVDALDGGAGTRVLP